MTDTKLQKPEEKSKPDNDDEYSGYTTDEIYSLITSNQNENSNKPKPIGN